MIVFYRNYKRSERVFYCAQSVKHFYPNADIRCLMVYDESEAEYKTDIPELHSLGIKLYFHKKIHTYDRYGNGEPSLSEFHKEQIKTFNIEQAPGNSPGIMYGPLYSFFITEYLNAIYEIVNDIDDKILILDEDQYFSTGETIEFLLSTDFDIAYGHYDTRDEIHQFQANILCLNPTRFKKMFPINDIQNCFTGPEAVLGVKLWIPAQEQNLKCVTIPTRHGFHNGGYVRDGKHVQSKETILEDLNKHNIPYINFAGVV